MRLAIFASGSGSNAGAIIEAVERKQLAAEVALIVCDKPGAKVVERAASYGIPVVEYVPKHFDSKVHYEQAVVTELKKHRVDFLVLSGYMRLVGTALLEGYEGKIVNIHPSLLPSFPGLDAIGQALRAGVKVTGVTIHYVDAGMDTGPIIAQEPVRIKQEDTRESLTKNIQVVEHNLYAKTLQRLLVERAQEGSKI